MMAGKNESNYVIDAKSVDATDAKNIDVIDAKSIDVTDVKSIDVIDAKSIDVVDAKSIDVVDAKGVDVIDAKSTDVNDAKNIDIIDAKSIDVTDAKRKHAPENTAMETGDAPDVLRCFSKKRHKSAQDHRPIRTASDFYADQYKMDYLHRGKAVIICNKNFDKGLGLGTRAGADADIISLEQRFTEMGFDVEQFTDLTIKTMQDVLRKAAADEKYNEMSDCFVCAISTHGDEGVVYGTDDKIALEYLLDPFKGSQSTGLLGKPKLFFIQACRGRQVDAGAAVDVVDAKHDMDDRIQVLKIPSEADFLIAYSVTPGYFSFRNSTEGSWFIQALSKIFFKHWKRMDLLSMMTRVNKAVAYEFESNASNPDWHKKKQIPCITSMLTKELIFLPKL